METVETTKPLTPGDLCQISGKPASLLRNETRKPTKLKKYY